MYEIYVITNKSNGKVYVGQTCQGVMVRWKYHCQVARKGSSFYFSNAIQKYGPDSFEHRVVAETESKEWANYLEKIWILLLNSTNQKIGYNSTQGGEGFASGDLHHLRINPKRGPDHPSFGKPKSPEVRAKISQTLTGLLVGEKNPFFGKQHSEETRKLIGDIQRGQVRGPHGEETRDKIRQRMLGRKFSEETLKKMRDAKIGRKLSDEHKAKLVEAQAARRKREAETTV